LVVWSESLIARVKMAGKEDWPIAHGASAMELVFKSLPVDCHVQTLAIAFDGCSMMEAAHTDPVQYMQVVQWRDMFTTMRHKGIHRESGSSMMK
jgi:hypothetical protein